jgi:hypothetical protein
MKNPLISFLASSILLFGCSSPKEVMYDTSKRAPTTDIEVFREGVKPEKPYKEIGEISFESFGGEDAHAMKELVAKAKARRKRHCNVATTRNWLLFQSGWSVGKQVFVEGHCHRLPAMISMGTTLAQ